MRNLLVLFILGLCLNSSWATVELLNEEDEVTLQKSLEPLGAINPNKFTNLIKSTMDLMGPDLEVSQSSQATEVTELSPD
jgi:hypothetical protein